MTNNMDDFDQQEGGFETEELPAKNSVKANLVAAWKTQPLIKLLALMVVVGALAAVSFALFSGDSGRSNSSSLVHPPNLHEAPGGQASQYLKEQTKMADQQRAEEAAKKGTSNLPTPMGGDFVEAKHDDTLNELKAQIESLTRAVNTPKPAQQQQQQVQAAPKPAQPQEFDDNLAKAMQKEMGELSAGWTPHGLKKVEVTQPVSEAAATAHAAATAAADANPPVPTSNAPKIIIPAGTVSYAQLLTQANSDVPGPVLAEIVSGPLAGARAIGSFQVENTNVDYLVLRFTLAELKGKEYSINTLAIDPNTSLGGLATDVDQRYFERVVLPAAASFLQGLGGALGSGSSTTSTNGTTTLVSQAGRGLDQGAFQGASQAAQTVGQFFQNQANQTKPLVIVAAGTPMGLLFVTSLKTTTPDAYAQQRNGLGLPMGLGNNAPSAYEAGFAGSSGAYPGTTVAGSGAAPNQNASQNVPYPNYAQQGNSQNGFGNFSSYGSPFPGAATSYNNGYNSFYPH